MGDKVSVKLPHELITLSGLTLSSLEAKSVLIWVLELYSEGKISLSKAASKLEMKNDEFLEEFHKRRLKEKSGPKSVKEAEEDLEVAKQFLSGN